MLDEDDGQDGPAATPLLPEPLDNCDVEPLLLPWPAGRVGTAPVLFTPIKTPGENRGKKVLESKENVVKVFFFTGRRERGDEGYRKEENLQVNNRIVSQVRRTFFFISGSYLAR